MSGEAVLDRVLSAGDGIHLVLALEGSKDAPRSLIVSRKLPFKDVLGEIGRVFNIPATSKLRLYDRAGSHIEDLSMCSDGEQLVVCIRGDVPVRRQVKPPPRVDSPAQKLKTVGPYRILRLLGEGGFGAVRLGEHSVTRECAALKFISKAGLTAADADRIITEISCLAELLHPNIVRLLEVFNEPDYMVLALEYAMGGDLRQYLSNQPNGRLSEIDASDKFAQIVKGVSFAHSRKVAHRDLKLENILLSAAPSSGTNTSRRLQRSRSDPVRHTDELDNTKQCLITDFGLSQFTRPGEVATESGGSLYYMSPEIIRAQAANGPAVDVWCLGVMLFTMLSGRTPFRSKTLDGAADRLKAEHIASKARSESRNTSREGRDVGSSPSKERDSIHADVDSVGKTARTADHEVDELIKRSGSSASLRPRNTTEDGSTRSLRPAENESGSTRSLRAAPSLPRLFPRNGTERDSISGRSLVPLANSPESSHDKRMSSPCFQFEAPEETVADSLQYELTPRDYERDAEALVDLNIVVKEIRTAILAGIDKVTFPACIPDEAASLIRNMLNPDPEKRPTAAEVAAHPWFLMAHSRQIPGDVDTQSRMVAVRALTSGHAVVYAAEPAVEEVQPPPSPSPPKPILLHTATPPDAFSAAQTSSEYVKQAHTPDVPSDSSKRPRATTYAFSGSSSSRKSGVTPLDSLRVLEEEVSTPSNTTPSGGITFASPTRFAVTRSSSSLANRQSDTLRPVTRASIGISRPKTMSIDSTNGCQSPVVPHIMSPGTHTLERAASLTSLTSPPSSLPVISLSPAVSAPSPLVLANRDRAISTGIALEVGSVTPGNDMIRPMSRALARASQPSPLIKIGKTPSDSSANESLGSPVRVSPNIVGRHSVSEITLVRSNSSTGAATPPTFYGGAEGKQRDASDTVYQTPETTASAAIMSPPSSTQTEEASTSTLLTSPVARAPDGRPRFYSGSTPLSAPHRSSSLLSGSSLQVVGTQSATSRKVTEGTGNVSPSASNNGSGGAVITATQRTSVVASKDSPARLSTLLAHRSLQSAKQ